MSTPFVFSHWTVRLSFLIARTVQNASHPAPFGATELDYERLKENEVAQLEKEEPTDYLVSQIVEAADAVALFVAEGVADAVRKRLVVSFAGDPAARPRWLGAWCSAVGAERVAAELRLVQQALLPFSGRALEELAAQQPHSSCR